MKVEMAIVKKHNRSTRALTAKPFLIDERWADRLEKASKGKIRRVSSEAPTRRRRKREEE